MEKVKYSIIMPYYQRADQLHNTLLSYRHWYSDRDDYEIIIIEDIKNKSDHLPLMDVIDIYPNLPIRCYTNHVNSYNPSTHFNFGYDLAVGDYLVITNPEIFHEVNILEGFDEIVKDNVYIVCSCKRSQRGQFLPRFIDFEKFTYNMEDWIQHTDHRNTQLHWCTCISMNDYTRIGGFDDEYSKGFAWEDTDFINTIKYQGLDIINRDDLITVHQCHKKSVSRKMDLFNRNQRIYEKKWGISNTVS